MESRSSKLILAEREASDCSVMEGMCPKHLKHPPKKNRKRKRFRMTLL